MIEWCSAWILGISNSRNVQARDFDNNIRSSRIHHWLEIAQFCSTFHSLRFHFHSDCTPSLSYLQMKHWICNSLLNGTLIEWAKARYVCLRWKLVIHSSTEHSDIYTNCSSSTTCLDVFALFWQQSCLVISSSGLATFHIAQEGWG